MFAFGGAILGAGMVGGLAAGGDETSIRITNAIGVQVYDITLDDEERANFGGDVEAAELAFDQSTGELTGDAEGTGTLTYESGPAIDESAEYNWHITDGEASLSELAPGSYSGPITVDLHRADCGSGFPQELDIVATLYLYTEESGMDEAPIFELA